MLFQYWLSILGVDQDDTAELIHTAARRYQDRQWTKVPDYILIVARFMSILPHLRYLDLAPKPKGESVSGQRSAWQIERMEGGKWDCHLWSSDRVRLMFAAAGFTDVYPFRFSRRIGDFIKET
jgi:hypothetical protein